MKIEDMEPEDILELDQDADIKARDRLATEMRHIAIEDAIIIWDDEGRAYFDSGRDEDYRKAATHFGVVYDGIDKSPVNDALLKRYQELFEEARDEILVGKK